MKNKRFMVISAGAVLAVILAAFLAYTRSSQYVQPIPVTGRSNSAASQPNQIAQQNQADNSSVLNKFESAEEIQDLQGLQTVNAQEANSIAANKFESAEEIQAQQGLQALKAQVVNSRVTNKFESAEEIQAQLGLQAVQDQQGR
jgi:hypothetical protein